MHRRRYRRFSSIVNKLKVDRLGLAKYPHQMAYRYGTPLLSRMKNGVRVRIKGDQGWLNCERQVAWILANRLPHPENTK